MDGTFIINKTEYSYKFAGHDTLLKVLRDNGHTEVKNGCEEGQCGACVVILDGSLVNSCQVLAASAISLDILTVKHFGDTHSPSIIQEAFVEAGAVQCGFCTPGFVLATYSLLCENPDPTEQEIKKALDGNLCRCTGYVKIIEAVKLAAKRLLEIGCHCHSCNRKNQDS